MNIDHENIDTSATNLIASSNNPELIAEQHIAEWQEPVTITLDERGLIHDCNNSGEKLFGYCRDDLIQQHVSRLFPQLSEVILVKNGNINPRMIFMCHCSHHFMAQARGGRAFLSELSIVLLEIAGTAVLKLTVWPEGNTAPA